MVAGDDHRGGAAQVVQHHDDTEEYAELRTIAGQLRTLLGISLIEILSKHSDDEVYLGQRDTPEWTLDTANEEFRQFGDRLVGIKARIAEMNRDSRLRNCTGPARLRYTLLSPNTSDGYHEPGAKL
uniref:Lipoxygenase domain-containing protein n=1 Tax=Oryza barthii TaxID=65489 RepID=A0A0D3G5W5_9ORYZ